MFEKILIANRGEIAVRIIRTCKRLVIRTVAVYSEADVRSVYVKEADEAVCIGPAPARASYLDHAKIITTALKHGCQAIHPGYGFLSENAGFAQHVVDAGLVFIGPSAAAIAQIGDKIASKALAIRIGVPVVPGSSEPLSDADAILRLADEIGFPLLLKPAAGGGGKGMRIVFAKEELTSALTACKEETRKSFADDRIFVERFILNPRHIEVQLLADQHGHVIHLGERECSVQRRYQKVIEETPSPLVVPSLRATMGDMACRIARESGYTNAGTAEFIVDDQKNFYFLEINTRLQVEHPVTELVTGLDLVELQLKIAANEPLPITQADVTWQGWAIEARICAEDPYRKFLPTTGMVTRYTVPRGKHIRLDSGIEAGSVISIYYDSLLAKMIAWGETRQEAIETLTEALNGYEIEGVRTNVDFANAIINHPAFTAGDLSTTFIEEHFPNGESTHPPEIEHLHDMAIATALAHHIRQQLVRASLQPMRPLVGSMPPLVKECTYILQDRDDLFVVRLIPNRRQPPVWKIEVNGNSYKVITPEFEFYRRQLRLKINGVSQMFRLQYQEQFIRSHFRGIIRVFEVFTLQEWEMNRYMRRQIKVVAENSLKCPMPGLITAVCVTEGAQVHKGDEVIRLESMKMETGIASPRDGVVEKILVQPGQTVDTNDHLMSFK